MIANIGTCAHMLSATLQELGKAAAGKGDQDSALVTAVPHLTEATEQAEGAEDVKISHQDLAVCHCCALEPEQATFWTLSTAIEQGRPVLMAAKGALSKTSNMLERMCIYRIPYPNAYHSGERSTDLTALKRRIEALLKPYPCNDTLQERTEKMQAADKRIGAWYKDSTVMEPAEVFCPDVVIFRGLASPEGDRNTILMTFEDLRTIVQPHCSPRRKYHCLAQLHDPQHCVSYHQGYEVNIDDNGCFLRQSSIRVRVYDPRQDYKLRTAIILMSDPEAANSRVIRSADLKQPTDMAGLTSPSDRPHPGMRASGHPDSHSCAEHTLPGQVLPPLPFANAPTVSAGAKSHHGPCAAVQSTLQQQTVPVDAKLHVGSHHEFAGAVDTAASSTSTAVPDGHALHATPHKRPADSSPTGPAMSRARMHCVG